MRWYKGWHEKKLHKHIHVAVLLVYVLSILAGVLNLPTGAEAAWNNNKTWTTMSDFETAPTLSNIAISGDNDANDANDNDGLSLSSQTEKSKQ